MTDKIYFDHYPGSYPGSLHTRALTKLRTLGGNVDIWVRQMNDEEPIPIELLQQISTTTRPIEKIQFSHCTFTKDHAAAIRNMTCKNFAFLGGTLPGEALLTMSPLLETAEKVEFLGTSAEVTDVYAIAALCLLLESDKLRSFTFESISSTSLGLKGSYEIIEKAYIERPSGIESFTLKTNAGAARTKEQLDKVRRLNKALVLIQGGYPPELAQKIAGMVKLRL